MQYNSRNSNSNSSSSIKLIATNSDDHDKYNDKYTIPVTGIIVNTISTTTGITPIYCGKPSDIMIKYIDNIINRSRSGSSRNSSTGNNNNNSSSTTTTSSSIDRKSIIMIGDRLDTDIAFANIAGYSSCLVLTGCSSSSDADDATGTRRPTVVADSLWSFVNQT